MSENSQTYGSVFGNELLQARNILFTTGNATDAVKTLLSSTQFRNLLNTNSQLSADAFKSADFDNQAIIGILRYFQNGDKLRRLE